MNQNKHIVITGVSGNLGKAAASYFSSLGFKVTGIWSPGKRPLEKNEFDFEADLTDEAATAACINQIIAKAGHIDVLLSLAGGFEAGALEETSLDTIRRMMRINFETVWNTVRPVFSKMKSQSVPGRIVLVGARPAFDPDKGKGAVAYALSKSALNELAALINASATPNDIVCSVIVPGTIDTPQNRSWAGNMDISSWVTTEELAKGMEFLISPEAGKLREPVLRFYGD